MNSLLQSSVYHCLNDFLANHAWKLKNGKMVKNASCVFFNCISRSSWRERFTWREGFDWRPRCSWSARTSCLWRTTRYVNRSFRRTRNLWLKQHFSKSSWLLHIHTGYLWLDLLTREQPFKAKCIIFDIWAFEAFTLSVWFLFLPEKPKERAQ